MIFKKNKLKLMGFFLKTITLNRINAICLSPFGIYFYRRNLMQNKRLVNHEFIHWKQQLEMLVLPFYIWYILEWFIKLFIHGKNSYRNISFEREAFANDDNLKYLENRKFYSWLKYFIK